MFFQSMLKKLNSTYSIFTDNKFDNIDPNVVKYFRVEYGKDWKVALQHHLYKESIKKDKKLSN